MPMMPFYKNLKTRHNNNNGDDDNNNNNNNNNNNVEAEMYDYTSNN